jgi:hypothetical protein
MPKLLRITEAAAFCGFTVGTARKYVQAGIMPPARVRVGTIMFFGLEELRFFKQMYDKAKPNLRKSVRLRKRR